MKVEVRYQFDRHYLPERAITALNCVISTTWAWDIIKVTPTLTEVIARILIEKIFPFGCVTVIYVGCMDYHNLTGTSISPRREVRFFTKNLLETPSRFLIIDGATVHHRRICGYPSSLCSSISEASSTLGYLRFVCRFKCYLSVVQPQVHVRYASSSWFLLPSYFGFPSL